MYGDSNHQHTQLKSICVWGQGYLSAVLYWVAHSHGRERGQSALEEAGTRNPQKDTNEKKN